MTFATIWSIGSERQMVAPECECNAVALAAVFLFGYGLGLGQPFDFISLE